MNLKQRLTSRKFWLSMFGLSAGVVMGVYGILSKQQNLVEGATTLAITSISAFLAAEGVSDALVGYQAQKTQRAQIEQSTAVIQAGLVPPGFDGGLIPGNRIPPSSDNPVTAADTSRGQTNGWYDTSPPKPADTTLIPGQPK